MLWWVGVGCGVAQRAARVAATVLTRAAVDRGSRDNVTVVIVDLSPMTAAEVEAEAQLSEVGTSQYAASLYNARVREDGTQGGGCCCMLVCNPWSRRQQAVLTCRSTRLPLAYCPLPTADGIHFEASSQRRRVEVFSRLSHHYLLYSPAKPARERL